MMENYKFMIKKYNLQQLKAVFSEVKFGYKLYSSKYRVILNEIKRRELLEKTIKEESSDSEESLSNKEKEIIDFLNSIDKQYLDRFNKKTIEDILKLGNEMEDDSD